MSFATAKVLFSSKLKQYPAIFFPIAKLRETDKKRVVRRGTDLVIEGYWRCGNHFATYAFIVVQGRPVEVAHHFHAPAQLIQGLRWGVPSLLLIREPIEAVASATVFLEKEDPAPFLKFYCNFHEPLVDVADQLVVSDFPTTVNDVGAVIAAVNAKFGRTFALFDGSRESIAEVERRIRDEHEQNMGADAAKLPLPSEEKSPQAAGGRADLHPEHTELLAECRRLYEHFAAVSIAGSQTPEGKTP